MGRSTSEKGTIWERLSLFLLLAVGIVMLYLLSCRVLGVGTSQMAKQRSRSELISTSEIASLSVSEFVYNGIAQSLKDNGDPEYNVLYKSTVKVSADVNKIKFVFDEEQKTITFLFPVLTIEKPVIDVGSISIIPDERDLYMDEVMTLCRNDALEEALKSEKLITTAQENIQTIIDGWYSPVFQDYTFIYQFASTKGGDME